MNVATDWPMVRTPDGAVLGVDYRRTDLSPVTVPGVVKAQHVYQGDTVRLGGAEVVVVSRRRNGAPGVVYLGVRTAGGAEVVHELRDSERVHVVAVGAFDV